MKLSEVNKKLTCAEALKALKKLSPEDQFKIMVYISTKCSTIAETEIWMKWANYMSETPEGKEFINDKGNP